MSVSLEGFVQCACDSGLLSAEVVDEVRRSLPAEERPQTADELADELVRRNLLTPYQAARLRAGDAQGLVLGEYVILDELGSGGMGQVYRAVHAPMDRVVAIKTLRAKTLDSPHGVQRFSREVKAAARLVHPNVVTAFDAGHDRGMHYLAMEFVEGTNLSQLVKEHGPLDVGQAVDCITQAARGLGYAHRQGITHRDVKPANLMRTPEGGIKLLDLGLARLIQASGSDEAAPSDLTHEGSVIGTVDYMAPEQGEDTRQADHRSDIYSLGCTLYYLLTGRTLYSGETRMKKLLAHREQAIPSLRAVRPSVSTRLEAVFQRMVAKRREDRQQSMDELLGELEKCVDAENLSETRSVSNGRTPAEAIVGSRTAPLPSVGVPRPFLAPPPATSGDGATVVDSTQTARDHAGLPSGGGGRSLRGGMVLAALGGVLLIGYFGLGGLDAFRPEDEPLIQHAAPPIGPNQRQVAEWVLAHKGEVGIVPAAVSGTHTVRTAADLPPGSLRIKTILLDAAAVTDESLVKLDGLDELTELNLRATGIGDAGLKLIAELKSLETLRLDYVNFTDEGIRAIARLPKLRILELNQSPLGNAGLSHLGDCRTLESLFVSGCPVSDEGVKRLGRLDRLVYLLLDATQVTDAALPTVGTLTGLKKLDLSDTQVTDAGMPHLIGLINLGNLRLQNTAIGDDGLKPLQSLTNLRFLDLGGTRVTDQGLAEFRAALPQCEVVRD